jgi:hypothetical protein
VTAGKSLDDRGQPGFSDVVGNRQRDAAIERGAGRGAQCLVVQIEQALRISQQGRARLRERHPLSGPQKHRLAKLLLEPLHLQAHRRLRSADPSRRTRKAAGLDDRHQGSHDRQIERLHAGLQFFSSMRWRITHFTDAGPSANKQVNVSCSTIRK